MDTWQESDLRKRKEIAEQQLSVWKEIAGNWITKDITRDYRRMRVCAACQQTLWFNEDQYENAYDYTEDEMLALKVAHIRQRHAEVNQ